MQSKRERFERADQPSRGTMPPGGWILIGVVAGIVIGVGIDSIPLGIILGISSSIALSALRS